MWRELTSLRYRLLGVLVLAASMIGLIAGAPSSAGAQQQRECFTETGFCIAAPDFQQYFHLRGGVSTFGYPVSRELTLLGFRVQFFQGHILQRLADGRITTMNLLGPGLMPATHIDGATFPASDPAIVAATPRVDDLEYATAIVTFTASTCPTSSRARLCTF